MKRDLYLLVQVLPLFLHKALVQMWLKLLICPAATARAEEAIKAAAIAREAANAAAASTQKIKPETNSQYSVALVLRMQKLLQLLQRLKQKKEIGS